LAFQWLTIPHLASSPFCTTELLILFDDCKHVVEAVTDVAEAILRGAPKVRIPAASCEPLRAEGEWMQPLALSAIACSSAREAKPGNASVDKA
jgi:hypothetical protein